MAQKGSVNLSAHFVWASKLTGLHRLSRLPYAGVFVIASLADPTGLNLKPRARIFLAAFMSRSTLIRHDSSSHFSSGTSFVTLVASVRGLPCSDPICRTKDLLRIGGGELVSFVAEFANGLVNFMFLDNFRSQGFQ